MLLRVNGGLHHLWRAVDENGVVLDIVVQDRRNATAARRLPGGLRVKPRRIVTDGLKSYGVAHRELMPEVRHRTSRYLNNPAEHSHRPTRRRERQMQRFTSPEQVPRFVSAHAMIHGHFRPRRHLMSAAHHRRARAKAFQNLQQETCVQAVAYAASLADAEPRSALWQTSCQCPGGGHQREPLSHGPWSQDTGGIPSADGRFTPREGELAAVES